MYTPLTLPFLGLLGLMLVFLFVMLEIGVIESAFHKLGMSHRAISSLLMFTILGSYINIPIGTIVSGTLIHDRVIAANGIDYVVPQVQEAGRTIIAINVGGALIPLLLSAYLLWRVGGIVPAAAAPAVSMTPTTSWPGR